MARRSNSKFFRQLNEYKSKTDRQREFIAQNLVLQLGNAAQVPQPGIRLTGGAYQIGKIPIDTWTLFNSFTVAVNFRIMAKGPNAHVIAASGIKTGDRFQFWWAMPYAKRIEFGFSGQDVMGRRFNQKGRLFATTAFNKWPAIKKQVIAESENA